MTHRVAVLIGTSEGFKEQQIADAITRLQNLGTVALTSSIYKSEPWGFNHSEWFLNQLVVMLTDLSPERLLEELLSIEANMGRLRKSESGYQSRIIDLDILFYEDRVLDTPNLTLPHPRMCERRFVLVPLVEVEPEWIHPVMRITASELLQKCDDQLNVVRC